MGIEDPIPRFPLAWPEGTRRTPKERRRPAAFRHRGRRVSTAEAKIRIMAELDHITRAAIISSNVRTTHAGSPRSGLPEPSDVGVAVYFTAWGRLHCLACDRWDRVADNLVAVVKHVEALRGIARWGVGTVEAAFRGYAALPPAGVAVAPSPSTWWHVLGVDRRASPAEIRRAYMARVELVHTDRQDGGDVVEFTALNAAREAASRARGVRC